MKQRVQNMQFEAHRTKQKDSTQINFNTSDKLEADRTMTTTNKLQNDSRSKKKPQKTLSTDEQNGNILQNNKEEQE